jgi:hypothetical protein
MSVEQARAHLDAARADLGRAARLAGAEAGPSAMNAMEDVAEHLDALGALLAGMVAVPASAVSAGADGLADLLAEPNLERVFADALASRAGARVNVEAVAFDMADALRKAVAAPPASAVSDGEPEGGWTDKTRLDLDPVKLTPEQAETLRWYVSLNAKPNSTAGAPARVDTDALLVDLAAHGLLVVPAPPVSVSAGDCQPESSMPEEG